MRHRLPHPHPAAGAARRTAGTHDALLLGLVLCLPVPLLAVTGLAIPLPTGVVEAFVSIVPGGGDAAVRATAPPSVVDEAPVPGTPDAPSAAASRVSLVARARAEIERRAERPDPPATRVQPRFSPSPGPASPPAPVVAPTPAPTAPVAAAPAHATPVQASETSAAPEARVPAPGHPPAPVTPAPPAPGPEPHPPVAPSPEAPVNVTPPVEHPTPVAVDPLPPRVDEIHPPASTTDPPAHAPAPADETTSPLEPVQSSPVDAAVSSAKHAE